MQREYNPPTVFGPAPEPAKYCSCRAPARVLGRLPCEQIEHHKPACLWLRAYRRWIEKATAVERAWRRRAS